MEKRLEFWFSLVSPYAYLTAMRINRLADEHGVTLDYHPMAMPPIYAALGWKVNPFADYPFKLDYVWRDVARTAQQRRLAFQKPKSFPQDPLLATRAALIGFEEGWGWDFSRQFYEANFQTGCDPASPELIEQLLANINVDAAPVLDLAQSLAGHQKLEEQTARALKRGVFGAPFFFVNDDPFWGDDRLKLAIEYAAKGD